MKPIKLVISAIGPYADKTEIDFNKIGQNGLYLICGDTGTGKTTIFDCISYALYGEVSGGKERKKANTLRSDYAKLETPSYVELEFEHKGGLYYIKRNPSYERKSKRGNDVVAETAAVVFTDLISNKTITGSDAAKAAIQELIGLTRDQFSQTVMIAQNDFLKIIKEDTSDKTALFQKIFGTSIYRDFIEKLRNKNSILSADKEKIDSELVQKANDIVIDSSYSDFLDMENYKQKADTIEKLIPLLEDYVKKQEADLNAFAKRIGEIDAESNKLLVEKTKKENENKVFDSYNQATSDLQKLSAQQKDILDKTIAVENAKKADKCTIAKNTYEATLKQIKDKNTDLINVQKNLATKTSEQKTADAELAKAQAEQGKVAGMSARITMLNTAIPLLKELHQKQNTLNQLKGQLATKLADLKAAERNFDEVRDGFLASQAYLLAKDLQANKPCPVCGSLSHPSIAKASNQTYTKADYDKAEKAKNACDKEYKDKFAECGKVDAEIDTLTNNLTSSSINVTASDKTLEAEMKQLQADIVKINNDFVKADNNVKKIANEIALLNGKVGTIQNDLTSLNKQKDVDLKAFNDALTQNGFNDESEYQKAILPSNVLNAYEKEIDDYKKKDAATKALVDNYKKQLNGMQAKHDLTPINNKLNDLNNEKADITKKQVGVNKTFGTNDNVLKALKGNIKTRQDIIEEYTIVDYLYRTCSGNLKGNARIDFETYVQQYYFNNVVVAANKRLRALSDNMFTLRCKEITTGGQARTGLDLEVFDENTHKWRDISSLSGGESFLAALAMAIGLSDVVQRLNGGVRIDSLYIDEGFGTLDETHLNNCLNMLNDLADGNRIVGIISHRNEIKARIDTKVIVSKKGNGSSVGIEHN